MYVVSTCGSQSWIVKSHGPLLVHDVIDAAPCRVRLVRVRVRIGLRSIGLV